MYLGFLGIRHSVSDIGVVGGHRPAHYQLGLLILTTALFLTTALLIGCGGGVAAAPKGTPALELPSRWVPIH